MAKGKNRFVGLDVGTTKVCAIICQMDRDGVDVVGIGLHPCQGMREGTVIILAGTARSIKKAVEDAEIMAGHQVSSVYAGISGGHIKSFNSHGAIDIKHKEILAKDISKVMETAKAVAISQDREVLHILNQEFIVDGQRAIREPLGMSGTRLEAKIHIVTAGTCAAQNVVRCVNKAGLEVKEIVLQSLAASQAVLGVAEMDLGVGLIDIGGGTTDLAVFHRGSLVHTAVLPLGGNHITSDIAIGLRTSAEEAERIKKRFGCALAGLSDMSNVIELVTLGERATKTISQKLLAEIIEARAEEILELAHQEIVGSGFEEKMTAGVVLTGGSAQLDGMAELAEMVFGLRARVGIPGGVGGLVSEVLTPVYATGVGLVLYGYDQEAYAENEENGSWLKGLSRRLRYWLTDF